MSINRDAVTIANERLWNAHPELDRRQLTLNAEDAQLRREWMQFYQEAQNPPPPPSVVPEPVDPPPAVEASPVVSCPESKEKSNETREIKSITIKRKHIDLFGDDKYGHWWFEIDGDESYGWWPKGPVGLSETLRGTDGELNVKPILVDPKPWIRIMGTLLMKNSIR